MIETKCKNCNALIIDKVKKFCNSSCSASYNNKLRIKGQKRNFSETGKDNIKEARKERCEKLYSEYENKKTACIICGSFLSYKRKFLKTCSLKCKNQLSSLNRSAILLEKGTSNFKTKIESFDYKFLKNFKVDSKLEKAGLIYLIDILKFENIEKFQSILTFKEGEITRRFNPDFYCKKDDKIFIVEVKMKWIKTSNHIYNRTIPLKKEAIKKFCEERNYEMIWLDFDYDIEFKKIYKRVCSSKAEQRSVKP